MLYIYFLHYSMDRIATIKYMQRYCMSSCRMKMISETRQGQSVGKTTDYNRDLVSGKGKEFILKINWFERKAPCS